MSPSPLLVEVRFMCLGYMSVLLALLTHVSGLVDESSKNRRILIKLRKWDLYSLRAHGQRLFEMTAEPFFRNG